MISRLEVFCVWSHNWAPYVTRTLLRPEAAVRYTIIERETYSGKADISYVTENFKFRCFISGTLNFLKFQFSPRRQFQVMKNNIVLIWCLHIAPCRRPSYYSFSMYEISCYNRDINFWSKAVFVRSLITDNTGISTVQFFKSLSTCHTKIVKGLIKVERDK